MMSSKEFDYLRIPLEKIKSATNNFSYENFIGRGAFGRVYKGELSDEEGRTTTIAPKRLHRRLGQGDHEFWREYLVLSKYKHENLISLVGICDESGERILVYKYLSHGSLDLHLNSVDLNWMKRLQICVGAARGLSYLHNPSGTQQTVVYGDVKSANILLDENWEAKLTNFGLSNLIFTIGYVDPSYMETGFLTKATDVFSFGVVLFEVLCGRLAFENHNDGRQLLYQLAQRCYEEKKMDEIIDPILRKQMDPDSLTIFSAIAYQCLRKDKKERPTMDQILQTLEKVLNIQREFEKLQQVIGGLKEEAKKDDRYKVKNLEHLKIPLEEIKRATNDFDVKHFLGRGGYGSVYMAELFHFDVKKSVRENDQKVFKGELSGNKRRQSTVAIKRLDSTSLQGGAEFLQEIEVLSCFRHQNLVSLLGFCNDDGEMILVYEYAVNGSLDRYFRSTNNEFSHTWAQRVQYCLDVSYGLDYLHDGVGEKFRIIHRDIKSANILLGRNWEGMICDFGLSRIGPAGLQVTFVMTNVAGTFGYVDPHYWKTSKLTKKSDVYSFGLVLFEVLCGRLLLPPKNIDDPDYLPHLANRCFDQKMINEIIDPKLKEEFKKSSSIVDNETCPDSIYIFSAIAHKCLQNDPDSRPTMAEVVNELGKALKVHVKGVEVLRTSLEAIKFATHEFSEEKVIGQGGFGKVYKGELSHSKGHGVVAVKRLDCTMGSYGEREFFKEISMLFSYSHENIIPLLGFCEEASEKIILFEYAKNGSLDKHLNNINLTWKQRLQICINAARGLDYIHSSVEHQHTVHGDIKSSNILLNHDWKATISDFIITKSAGTFGYLDPVYMKRGTLTKESDVFSFGVVLFEILSGRLAIVEEFTDERRFLAHFAAHCFEHKKLEGIIYHGIKEQIQANSLDLFSTIAYQCLQEHREERPTMAQVIEELEKAFEFQDEWEWEQKLPRDYDKIIKMSKSPEFCSTKMKKELYSLLSSGILLDKDKVWFSLIMEEGRSELISATKFSYKNFTSLKWRSVRKSRFPKVAKMLDISNLSIQIQIRTQFLSPGIIYGAYLVFKFCDRRKVSSRPIYVKLKYIKENETLNSYFAEWRDNKWMMIELCRFFNKKESNDFEVLLESFSRYYCGSGAIFVEGIEFRPIDNLNHEQNKELKDEKNVQRLLKPDSNMDLGQQLPSDYREIIKRSQKYILDASEEKLNFFLSNGILIDKGEKLFSLSKANGKKCHMLPAKAVIYKSSNVKCCIWKPPFRSRFAEVVELLSHQVFRIKCNIETQMLSPDTTYGCYLVFKLSEKCRGLECPVKARDLLPNRYKETKIISFRFPSPVNLPKIKWVPEEREDGWMEVIVWEVLSNKEHDGGYLPMDLELICFEGNMSGLIVCGTEFRPI